MFGVLLVLMGCLAFHADAGTNFIYWGGVCSGSAGSKIIYRGWAAKTPTNKKGGGATYLCLPSNPQWHATVPGIQGKNSLIVGTEFHHDGLGSLIPNSKWDHADIPCTACVVPAASQQIMIPGWVECPSGWTSQYTGYLMAEPTNKKGSKSQSNYICVVPKGMTPNADTSPNALASFVEVWCGILPCSIYGPAPKGGRELACVVCTQ